MTIGVLNEVKTRVNGAIVEHAPDWYDKPLDKLDLQWSQDEKLEIERYCEKINAIMKLANFHSMSNTKNKERTLL